MPKLNALNSAEIAEIQQRMARIRREMHKDVQGAVRGAQSLTDWRNLLANHPWAGLGIAMGLGYLIVPRKKMESRSGDASAAHALVEAKQALAAVAASESARTRFRPVGFAFRMLTPVLFRAAQNYALNQLEQWLASHPFGTHEGDSGRRVEPRGPAFAETEAPTVRFPERR